MFSFKSRKFRVDILTIFITIFLSAILSITYYFYSKSNTAVLKVANSFIKRTIDSVSQKLDEFLQPKPFFNIANMVMTDHRLDSADMNTLFAYMHIILTSYPQLVNAYISDTSGNLFIETRVTGSAYTAQLTPLLDEKKIPSNAKFVSEILTDHAGTKSAKLIYKNQSGKSVGETIIKKHSYDPRKRPWFINAKAAGQSPWISIYPTYDFPQQVVTVAFPIYIQDQFKGVAAADISVESIRSALKEFSIDTKGLVFITNHAGKLIAYQEGDNSDTNEDKVTSIQSTDNEIIKKAYLIHKEKKRKSFTFKNDGTTYIANFKPYNVSSNEQWEIAAVIPINVFIGSINHANKEVLIFSLITLLVGLGLVILCSNRISKPIIKIAHEIQDMQHFNFTKTTDIKSYIYEVQVMVTAMNIAKSSLHSFSKYVPRTLVDQLLKLGNIAKPEGSKKKITVLFSDITNFSAISENTEADKLMPHLSEYLNILTRRIHANHGNIDKYIGDAIMAFWGAPEDDTKQITHACRAILECQHESHMLCKKFQQAGKPQFHTRFALNCGNATVGNLGSEDRLNYTAIGDTVNIAARLEDINKSYHTEIIVSEDIYQAAKNEYLFRPIDKVMIKGKQEEITIYELMAEKSYGEVISADNKQQKLAELFAAAYQQFHSNNITKAYELFTEIEQAYPNDALTKIYINRCNILRNS